MNAQMKAHIDRFRAAARGRVGLFHNAAEQKGDLYVYDAIGSGWFGGISASDVVNALAALKTAGATQLHVYINSPGGDVFDGVAIYNAIHRFEGEKTVTVDGLAASVASVVAMAGGEIEMAANSMMMIHDPWGGVMGTANDMRKTADALDQVKGVIVNTYAARTGCAASDLGAWMTSETWMTAEQAKDRGFCDTVLDPAAGDAATDEADAQDRGGFPLLNKYKRTPPPLRAAAMSMRAVVGSMQRRLDNLRAQDGAPKRTTK